MEITYILYYFVMSRDIIIKHCNFQSIDFEWNFSIKSTMYGCSSDIDFDEAFEEFKDKNNCLFDTVEVTQKFDCNDYEIVKVNGDLSNDSIGTFYQNMIYWVKKWFEKKEKDRFGYPHGQEVAQKVFKYCICKN